MRRIKNYERYILGPERMGEIPIDIALEPVADLCGTVFSAIQFALFGGASKIFLVGFDCNVSHFFEKDVNSMNLSGQYPSWLRIKDFQEDYFTETEIISVNPVGLKGLFKDIYTQSYVDAHPELLKENIEIINEEIVC